MPDSVESGLYARTGEVVTCERGHPIASVARDIHRGDAVRVNQFDWIIADPPTPATPLSRSLCECGGRYIRCTARGVDLHVAGAWRPYRWAMDA